MVLTRAQRQRNRVQQRVTRVTWNPATQAYVVKQFIAKLGVVKRLTGMHEAEWVPHVESDRADLACGATQTNGS